MQLTQLKVNDSLLSYALLTTPEPLQVSPTTGPPSIGALTFVISCPLAIGSVIVRQIAFNLPVGDPAAPDATDLTDTATGMSPSVSSSDASLWSIGPGAGPGSFLLTPAPSAPGVIDGQGLTVTITNIQLSAIVGTSLLVIVETATDSGSPPIARRCVIAVPKFPYGFVAGNFAASAPMVNNGSTVGLSWIGSIGPTYTVLWGTQSQDVTTVNQWTSPALTDTTTFILEVSAQQGGQTVKLYYSVTVIVADPNITATTLDVLQGTTLGGATVLAATAPLTANAAVAANAGLAVTGGATADTLGVTGASTLASLSVTGAASAASMQTPSLNAAQATLGAATLTGSLTAVQGQVSLFSNAQGIQPGAFPAWNSYTPPTDGLVIGVIGWPANNPTAGCVCWGFGNTNGVTVYTTGGNMGFFGPAWGSYMASNGNSFLLPVAANVPFSIAVQQNTSGQQTDAPYWFYWVPFGTGAAGSTLQRAADVEVAFEPPAAAQLQRSDEARWNFIATLEKLLGKPIDEVTKEQLISELRGF